MSSSRCVFFGLLYKWLSVFDSLYDSVKQFVVINVSATRKSPINQMQSPHNWLNTKTIHSWVFDLDMIASSFLCGIKKITPVRQLCRDVHPANHK